MGTTEPRSFKLRATAPVLAAPDVGAIAKWYGDNLGFEASLFPDEPPHAFAILCHGEVEIMFRQCALASRPVHDWDVYIRVDGVEALHDAIEGRVRIVEPLTTKDYGCREFAIEDPNGYRVVFSEDVQRGE